MSNVHTEEYPALPIKPKQTRKNRSSSALSSVSTTSIGALDAVKTRIEKGRYSTLERIAVRPHLKCFCECCGAKVPEEDKWNLKCNKAFYVSNTGLNCEVIDSKVIRHGQKKFSVAYIETEYYNEDDQRVRGWVLSKCLKRVVLDAVKTRIANGSYYTLDTIAIRPRLKCLCESCGSTVPEEDTWCKCNRANYVSNTRLVCEVTDSKVIRHGQEKFSVAYIEYYEDNEDNEENEPVRGWVLSKCLNRYFRTDGSQSVARQPTYRNAEVDRSRSRSTSVFTAESPFCFGQLVLVRYDAATEDWVRGEVRQEYPLLILAEGTSRPQEFHAQNLKIHPTREFVTTVDNPVRSQQFRNTASFHTLKAGTTVKVAYMEGFEGRITSPVNGWISMRTEHFLNVIEPNWIYTPQNPTIMISKLPSTMTEKKLKRALVFETLTITFQCRGDEYRAIVSLRSNRKAVSRLVARKQLMLPKNVVAEVSWDMRYLKNLAAYQVQRK